MRSVVRACFPPWSEWKAAAPAFALAVLSALLLRTAFRPLYLSPLAFVALVPLFWGLRRCKPAMAFWVGWLFATIMALFGTWWFVSVSRFNPWVWAGILPLGLYIGFWFAVVLSLIVMFARRMAPWPALGTAMILWAGMEYYLSRGPLGMPYGLAQSQAGWLSMAQVVSLGGLPLLSALIVGFNLSAMETLAAFRARWGQGGALARLGVMTVLLALSWLHGARVLHDTRERYADPDNAVVRIALVQTGIDQMLKFESYTSPDAAERQRLQDELTLITLEMLRGIERGSADLVVTPESPFTAEYMDVEEEAQRRLYGGAVMLETLDIARDIEAPIVVGGVDNVFATIDGEQTEFLLEGINPQGEFFPGHRVYGGFWLLRPEQEGIQLAADYRKVQLMPFGETVPYLGVIPGFQEKIVQVGSFDRGRLENPVGMELAEGRGEVRIGPSICFEDQFPYIQRHFARRGANLFVNITNAAWFDGSPGPVWHGEMARWRSIETRLPMVRSTNSGITCAIAPTGEFIEQFPLLEREVHRVEVPVLQSPPRTLFTRLGNWFGFLALAASIVLVARAVFSSVFREPVSR